jgi:hypothetical protein
MIRHALPSRACGTPCFWRRKIRNILAKKLIRAVLILTSAAVLLMGAAVANRGPGRVSPVHLVDSVHPHAKAESITAGKRIFSSSESEPVNIHKTYAQQRSSSTVFFLPVGPRDGVRAASLLRTLSALCDDSIFGTPPGITGIVLSVWNRRLIPPGAEKHY